MRCLTISDVSDRLRNRNLRRPHAGMIGILACIYFRPTADLSVYSVVMSIWSGRLYYGGEISMLSNCINDSTIDRNVFPFIVPCDKI